jgi:hypothetical protein
VPITRGGPSRFVGVLLGLVVVLGTGEVSEVVLGAAVGVPVRDEVEVPPHPARSATSSAVENSAGPLTRPTVTRCHDPAP